MSTLYGRYALGTACKNIILREMKEELKKLAEQAEKDVRECLQLFSGGK